MILAQDVFTTKAQRHQEMFIPGRGLLSDCVALWYQLFQVSGSMERELEKFEPEECD
jgi:hypothetical protein